MNQKELKELIEFLVEKDIAEFELERGVRKVRTKPAGEAAAATAHEVQQMMVPAVLPAAAPPATAATARPPAASPPAEEAGLHTFKSPNVGPLFEAPSPGSPPIGKIGN